MSKRKRHRKKKIVIDSPQVRILTPEEQRKEALREKRERGKQKYLKRLGNRLPLPERRESSGVLKDDRGAAYSGIGAFKIVRD